MFSVWTIRHLIRFINSVVTLVYVFSFLFFKVTNTPLATLVWKEQLSNTIHKTVSNRNSV